MKRNYLPFEEFFAIKLIYKIASPFCFLCTHSKFVIDFLISKFNWWACLLCVLKWSHQAQRFRMNVLANWLVLSKISTTELMLTVVINEKVNIHTFILWFIHQHPENIMHVRFCSCFVCMQVFHESVLWKLYKHSFLIFKNGPTFSERVLQPRGVFSAGWV